MARAESPRLADCTHALSEKLQLFQARGKFSRRSGDGAHPFSRRSSGPRGPTCGHDVAMRRKEQPGRRGGRWTCSTARAWSEGARFRLTRKSHKYLDVDPRGNHHAVRRQKSYPTCSRCATRIRGRHSDAPARRPRPICSRITSSTPSRLARARRRAFDRPLAQECLPRQMSYLR